MQEFDNQALSKPMSVCMLGETILIANTFKHEVDIGKVDIGFGTVTLGRDDAIPTIDSRNRKRDYQPDTPGCKKIKIKNRN